MINRSSSNLSVQNKVDNENRVRRTIFEVIERHEIETSASFMKTLLDAFFLKYENAAEALEDLGYSVRKADPPV